MGLSSDTEELRDESGFCDHMLFGDPSNSSLTNHVHRLDAFDRSPGTLKGVVAFGQPGALFHGSVVLLNGLITNDKFCFIRSSPLKLRWRRYKGLCSGLCSPCVRVVIRRDEVMVDRADSS
jgi:hypothetical protein